MSRSDTLVAMARTLIGLAWIDGEVTPDEMDLLKDITFAMPELSAQDYDALDIYWITPIREAELEKLVFDLFDEIRSETGKQAAKELAYEVAIADGSVSREEKALLNSINTAIDGESAAELLKPLYELVQQALPKRQNIFSDAPNQKDFVDGFMKNRITTALKETFGDDVEEHLGLDTGEIKKLGLAGALMGRIAYADLDIDDEELAAINQILQSTWSLAPSHAAIVTAFATDGTRRKLDVVRLCREFYENTLLSERIDLLDILFEIAHAHDGISDSETREIEDIAATLKIDPVEFEAVRDHALRKELARQP